jgi:ABC-type amino acid transport substrate-binding protein
VIGLATFISTSLDGSQAIQGFNFLIPIDSIHAMAKQIGVVPSTDSPFTKAWDQAIDAFIDGRFSEALAQAEAADRLMPGLIDVRRAIARIRARMQSTP